jgi:hypothetical protein
MVGFAPSDALTGKLIWKFDINPEWQMVCQAFSPPALSQSRCHETAWNSANAGRLCTPIQRE